jgi:HD-GYP domain-containing protein (c-di-GMP phosphodiesterase class II)/HAMP domain-containing protein
MPDAQPATRRHPLHVHLTVLFSGLVLVTGALLAGLGYAGSRAIALAASETQFAGLARETGARLALALAPGARAVDLLAEHPVVAARGIEARFGALRSLAAAVEGQAFEAVYIGDPDGSFFLLRPLRDAALRTRFAAPDAAAYLIDAIDAGSAPGERIFLDAGLAPIGRRAREGEPYDPRTRPWYREAQQAGHRRITTAPYRFFSSGEAGVTVARRSAGGSVVALDVALDDLGRVLAEALPLPGARAALFDGARRVLASSAGTPPATDDGAGLPLLDTLADPALASLEPAAPGGSATRIDDAAGRTWQRMVVPVPTAREMLSLGMAIPLDELLAPARAVRDRTLAAALAVMLLALPLTYGLSRRVSRSLQTLGALADDIRAFRFDGAPAGRSPVLEVDQLAQAMDRMRATIRRFLDLTASLAAERRFPVLLERVASETLVTVGADAAAIYLRSADGATLRSASQVGANGSATSATLAPIALDAPSSPIAQALHDGKRVVAPPEAGGDALAPLGAPASASLVALPLANRAGEALGVVALAIGGDAAPGPAQLAFAEALSATATIAIETQRLFEERKALLDAFIRLLAGAIDAKSPYTGGHCQRVPELTLMLARAACDAADGPFADYGLDEGQWEALQIASWLHDCGKVTTPEYVVDKATKLETLYDRIHEVRMRFEVLKREAEIRCWRRIAEGAARAECEAERNAELATLDDEFRFVAACNEGGESMDAARIERLHAIARRSWLRTLDDRIGISHEELQRKQRAPAPALPVAEPLLADKPEHRIERTAAPPGAAGQEFNMQVPALQYDRGELLNLAIRHGTLTEEERYVINHHIVQTLQMLSQLPLPAHLRAVPELAGSHHEKMDGSGYPRGLTREQMSPAARMMAIADVFEALTASDRPYKRGKTLSESLAIMRGMCERQHLDGELFELFVTSGVCRRYAESYLRPEQIDLPDGAEAGRGPALARRHNAAR